GLQVQDGHVIFAVVVPPQVGAKAEPIRKEAEEKVHAMDGVLSATVVLTADKDADGGGAPQGGKAPIPEKNAPLLPGVKAIIAVASGKGGVGKSTTTVNLALALRDKGLRVGLLDADIYGPSIPRMLGISGDPESSDGQRLDPMVGHGIKCMSMGFLVDEDTPIIWRGPMVQTALTQLMRDVAWGELDVMVIDMPPGTGDVQLTMAQHVPLTGAVIVSTPQDIALLDARKGLNMFRQVDVPVLGIVENMSYFTCPHCGGRTDVFSHGGAKEEADLLGMTFLGEIPLDIVIRETSDSGHPIVDHTPDSEHAKAYKAIAEQVWNKACERLEAKAAATPRIVQ
ncbi:MAG: iron-sulfur cluster carrier protein ApbC, partial [Alphaproteobacteria bacterium]|nr:iron-sulfur cluster carrier protein ApbC [Alphaproteobacteria bacterium]